MAQGGGALSSQTGVKPGSVEKSCRAVDFGQLSQRRSFISHVLSMYKVSRGDAKCREHVTEVKEPQVDLQRWGESHVSEGADGLTSGGHGRRTHGAGR